MLFTETYQQALMAPTAEGGEGWAHADWASIQAAMAHFFGTTRCRSPQAIYDWANRHDVSLWDERERLMIQDVLLVALLNDWNLEETESKLRS